MTERKNPGVGLLMIIVSAAIFWGGASACVGYGIARHEESAAIRGACEELVGHGWNVSVDECVRELRP